MKKLSENRLSSDDISRNFTFAKLVSIMIVVMGHFFGGILWVPTTVALFLFAFSSAYFTVIRYPQPIDLKAFWRRKIIRLGRAFLIADLFLFLLFQYQHREGIFFWQTIPSLFGLTGLLHWLGFENPSPYGAGLWFMTVLIIFYCLYPFVEAFFQKHAVALWFLFVGLFLMFVLHYFVHLEYMLWMTSFAFVLGVYVGNHGWFIFSRKILFSGLVLLVGSLLLCNWVVDFKIINYFLIFFLSVFSVGCMFVVNMSRYVPRKLLSFSSGSVIYIYLIHTYLFVHLYHLSKGVNFILSLFVIFVVSYLLSRAERLIPV